MCDFFIMCCDQLVNNLNYFPITFKVYSTRALSVVVSFEDHIAESRPTTIKASSLLLKYYKELITFKQRKRRRCLQRMVTKRGKWKELNIFWRTFS